MMKIDFYKWKRILLVALLGSFNIEVAIGFTSIKEYFPWTFLAYFIPIAIVEDLRVRYRWNYKDIFLIGAIIGFLVDGIVLKAFFSPFWDNVFGPADFYDVRLLNFSSFVPFGHGFITYALSFIIADLLLPRTSGGSLLNRKHYAVLLPALLVLWSFMFYGIHSADGNYIPSVVAFFLAPLFVILLIAIHYFFKKKGGMYVFIAVMGFAILMSMTTGQTLLSDVSALISVLAVTLFILKKEISTRKKIMIALTAQTVWIIGGLFTSHVNPGYYWLDIAVTILFGIAIGSWLVQKYSMTRDEFIAPLS